MLREHKHLRGAQARLHDVGGSQDVKIVRCVESRDGLYYVVQFASGEKRLVSEYQAKVEVK